MTILGYKGFSSSTSSNGSHSLRSQFHHGSSKGQFQADITWGLQGTMPLSKALWGCKTGQHYCSWDPGTRHSSAPQRMFKTMDNWGFHKWGAGVSLGRVTTREARGKTALWAPNCAKLPKFAFPRSFLTVILVRDADTVLWHWELLAELEQEVVHVTSRLSFCLAFH